MLGADEVDLAATISTVFGVIADPRARLRAVRVGRERLDMIADKAVAECRAAHVSWRTIAACLGESHTTAFRHHGKTEPAREVVIGTSGEDGEEKAL